MGTFSLFHWLVFLAYLSILIPIIKILRRTGVNPVWSIGFMVPVVSWLMLWLFANAKWPAVDGAQKQA